MRRTIRRDTGRPGPLGWSNQAGVRPARRSRQGLHAIVLMIPLLVGMLGASVSPQVARGDELSDAKAKAAQLKKQVAEQKARVAALNDLQAGLAAEISDTKHQLRAIGADLTAVKKKIVKMEARIKLVKEAYADLVEQVKQMDAQLTLVIAQEAAKRVELSERRALLADRVRNAYDTDRTSPLETFLSGGTFTDILAEMSYYIDVGEQDQALADQITRDKETLAAMHQTVLDTRIRTNLLRQETAAQKRALDKSLLRAQGDQEGARQAPASRREDPRGAEGPLRRGQAQPGERGRDHPPGRGGPATAGQGDQQPHRAAGLARQHPLASSTGRCAGRWTTSTSAATTAAARIAYYAPGNGCAHYHNGIDLVAPFGTKVKAAAAGTVVYVGWNWADGADPAWVVVIAHSGSLKTWYAHMQPKRPVSVGQTVKKGTVIGYEGSTGNSTGAHLHWMVEFNGTFVNPRLFL